MFCSSIESLSIEIPDRVVGKKPDETAKTLAIQNLLDVVARQMEKQKR
jgi:hypothetical protein